ncbi:unnamed protein product [Ilex paraguariensis]|uniref:Uncharacterized protein n=1 Tax=Ilex paraguariensis TaxID=185542 RepID=A0ABC8TDV6_9AQUA
MLLFGKSKSFKTSKFKTIVSLAVSRIAILKKHHHIRWSQARSDVDHVIREQNILDAFSIIEGYCRLLIDRIMLIKNSKACPDELKGAISSLIFAASRYGQLPELQKIYRIFMAKYGKNFSNYAIELRNNCGVNPKIAKKFPTQWPIWGTKLKVLNEIASENGIILRVEGESSGISKEKLHTRESNGLNDHKLKDATKNLREGIQEDENFSRFMKERSKYRDVKTAAEAAFELAAQAVAAARAVVELSQSKLHEKDLLIMSD